MFTPKELYFGGESDTATGGVFFQALRLFPTNCVATNVHGLKGCRDSPI